MLRADGGEVATRHRYSEFASCLGCSAMEIRLDGRTALVTGGSRGIGQALALALASSGASVMISSRKAEGLADSVVAIDEAKGDRAGPVAWQVANAGDAEQAEACVAATVDRFGAVDILINNAATNPYFGPIMGIDSSRADKMVRVNQTGYLEWVQAAWRAGMSETGGVVLNMASVGGLSVEGGIGWYNVTKAAVIHLTSQLAGELGPKVRVNALAPGLVKTEFARALWEPGEDAIAGRLPLGRLGTVEDIANAGLFLCSDEASWITGHTLVIDGGALCIESGGIH
jgi:NAD(P)-dependent dehydrogenase (short-subunit alcohol dehydrogenase family)